MTSHVNSYYAATLAGARDYPALGSSVAADVCVVGGGLAGLSTALELARAGTSVVVLEGARVGFGASGRNGGFVAAGYAEDLDAIARRVGRDHARELFALSCDGVRQVRENIAAFDIAAAQSRPGALRVLRHDDEAAFSHAPDRLREAYGYDVDYWPMEKVRAHLKSERYFQGLYDAGAVHIHPLNYVAGLGAACAAAGAQVFEQSAARCIEPKGAGHVVRTERGSVDAEHVVLCHSTYGRGLHAGLDRAVLPVATYVVATGPAPALLDAAIATEAAVADTRRAGDYYRRLADGRLLWGGRITTQRSEPSRLAHLLKRDIVAVYPQLAGLEIDHAWAGLMAYATHKMPIIGPLQPGIWAATGFGGHGLNTATVAGRLIGDAIARGDDRYRLFAPFGMPWAGGMAGRAATQAAYWYYQLRDRIDETRASRRARRRAGAAA